MNAHQTHAAGRRPSRRQFLRLSGAAAALLARPARAQQPAPAARVISPDAHNYHGWPTVTRLRSGRLLVVCSGGREEHVCPFGRVDLLASDDDGASWSWPRTLLDSDLDDRDAGILETAAGTLLVTTFTSLAYEPALAAAAARRSWPADKLRRWQLAQQRLPAAERQAGLGQWMIRSTDGGRSWSAPCPSIVNSPHGPIQRTDGRLLYAGKELWTGGRRVGVCESADDGASWRWLAEIPLRPGDAAEFLDGSGTTTRPTGTRRCRPSPPTAGARGACPTRSACGACPPTCCGCATAAC